MIIAKSKVTAQGRTFLPAEVRRRLDAGPGSVLSWEELDGAFVVRKAKLCTSRDIHMALFGAKPVAEAGPDVVKYGVRKYMRRRYRLR